MIKGDIKKALILGTLFILLTMSIVPIQATENKKEVPPQTAHKNGDNILGYITVEWESFWTTWNIKDLAPRVNFTQSDTRIFYFDEINGELQMNFTVVCKMKLLNNALFPRIARFEFYIPPVPSQEYVYNVIGPTTFWKDTDWKYINITVGPPEKPFKTNGTNATLVPFVGVRPFPTLLTFLTGIYETWEPITVVPNPIQQ